MTVRTLAEECKEQIIAWRREIHAQPEIAWEEAKTGARIVEQLESFGIEVLRVANTGVIGILRLDNILICFALCWDIV